MTLDEAIKRAEEVAEMKKALSEESELQGCSMYAIRCGKSAEEHRQLAEWLRELKAYKEQEPCEDAISREAAVVQLHHSKTGDDDIDVIIEKDIATIQALPPVTPKQKTGKWIELKDHKPEAYKAESEDE